MSTSDDIATSLRSRILSGEFAAGTTLPDIVALQRIYTRDHAAVRRALHALQREGVIELSLVAVVSHGDSGNAELAPNVAPEQAERNL